MTEVLNGHLSPETAFVVTDYPNGGLRCKMRYWLEYKTGKGVRMMRQSTNPKRPGDVWYKPHASIYGMFGGALFLDEVGHVQFTRLHEYMDLPETSVWHQTYGIGVPVDCIPHMNKWVQAKMAYEARRLLATG